jgi:hypothetical protein
MTRTLGLILAPAALSACVIFPVGGPANGTCIESEIDNFIGMQEIDLIATKAVMPVRVLHPDTPMTEEFQEDRANFRIGADGIISDAFCG